MKIKYLKAFNICIRKPKFNLQKKWFWFLLLFLLAVGLSIIIIKFKYNYNNNLDEPTSILVSVIMPCYNSEKYLPNLFPMFKAQTFKNYELIFIDDGSRDKTNLLIREQLKKDKRLKLITLKKNTGQANARNIGLKDAKGDYIIFLDSDDIFYPNLLNTSYELAIKNKVDILIFNFRCKFSNNTYSLFYRDRLFHSPYPINKVFAPTDIADNIFSFAKGVTWNKLFKRDFVIKNNLQFLNLKIHNDCFFVYTAYVLAKKIYVTNDVLMTYILHNKNSISVTFRSFRKESRETNLKELKYFLFDKKLYHTYKKAFIKLSNSFR